MRALLLSAILVLSLHAGTIDTTQVYATNGILFMWVPQPNGVDYAPVALSGQLVNEITFGTLPQPPADYGAFAAPQPPHVDPPLTPLEPPAGLVTPDPPGDSVVTPEPSTWALGIGALLVLGWKRRQR